MILIKKQKKDLTSYLPFIFTLLIGFITHCSLLYLEALAPDALATGDYKVAGDWELSLGRWGIQFIDNLRGGIIDKYIILLFSLIFLGLSSMVLCKIFDLKSKLSYFLISLIVGTAPQFAGTFLFIYCADSYCLSFLFSILAVYYITNYNEKKWLLPIGMILIVFSLSLYQAYIAVTVSLIVIYMMKKLFESKKFDLKKIIFEFTKYIFIVLLSMVLYLIITKIIMAACNVEFADYKGASSMSISNIISNIFVTIPRTYKDIYHYMFKESILYNKYWNRNIINFILGVLNVICFIYLLISSKKNRNIKIALFLILLLILPMCIGLIDIIMPDTLTNIVTGPGLICIYLYFIVIMLLINDENTIKYVKYASAISIILLCYTNIMSNHATYLSRNDVYKNYYTISSDVLTRVNSLDGYEYGMKWLFTDNIRYSSQYSKMSNGAYANDYETWDNVDGIWYSWGFYHKYLGVDLYLASKKDYYNYTKRKEVQEMPVYPSAGSIKIIDDIVVIKMSDYVYTH